MAGKRDYQVVGNAALQPYEKPRKPIKKKKQVRQNEEINAGSFKYVLFLAFIIVLIILIMVIIHSLTTKMQRFVCHTVP